MRRADVLVRLIVTLVIASVGFLPSAFGQDPDPIDIFNSPTRPVDNAMAGQAQPGAATNQRAEKSLALPAVSGTKGSNDSQSDSQDSTTNKNSTDKNAQTTKAGTSEAAKRRFALAANPRASSGFFGNGMAGRLLGLKEGVTLGGITVLDGNWLMSGGAKPNALSGNFLIGMNLTINAAKVLHIPGGQFGAEFIEFQGMNTNGQAGSIQEYNNITGFGPYSRLELHQLWWRQNLFHNKLLLKFGKLNGTSEFNTVLAPVMVAEPKSQDWTISDLTYAPDGLNPTLFLRLPGYYNTAYGATVAFQPTARFYASYGIFDGNAARFEKTGYVQTDLNLLPDFNSYKFHIRESGYSWRLGNQGKPGKITGGVWHQTGQLITPAGSYVDGATGFYAFASQRLIYTNPGKGPAGFGSFYQFGYSNSRANLFTRYAGGGITALSLIHPRPADSFGVGVAWSRLNQVPGLGQRPSEAMLQAYYQAVLIPWKVVIVGAYTSIPTPGAGPQFHAANALTGRLVLLF